MSYYGNSNDTYRAILLWALGFVVTLVVGAVGCVACNGCNTADSQMTGVVIHYGIEGAIWKTNEGSASLGFTQGGTGTVSTGDKSFCVDLGDQNASQQVERARDEGKPVKLYYHEVAGAYPWRCRSDRIVYRVGPIAAPAAAAGSAR